MNIGQEDGNYETYCEELDAFTSLFRREGKLRGVLINPTFDIPQRQGIIEEIGKRLRLSPLTINFLHLLVDKDRIRYLPDITALYRELVDEAAGRARVHLVTAHDLSKKKLKELTQGLEGLVGKQVIMEVETDPLLIGGVVARIGDTVYDGSVRTQLERLKEILAKG
ncbi:MAG: ATP synthase F1 subunit delta [Planctomycetes bacterium RBG_13_46_10]|nr:MAG: ATP synthase F1 subunit delta [Planctomycetes bacterium RBG_13_46_10]